MRVHIESKSASAHSPFDVKNKQAHDSKRKTYSRPSKVLLILSLSVPLRREALKGTPRTACEITGLRPGWGVVGAI